MPALVQRWSPLTPVRFSAVVRNLSALAALALATAVCFSQAHAADPVAASTPLAAPALPATAVPAEASPSTPNRRLRAIENALSDGLYDVVQTRAEAFLKASPESPDRWQVRLWLATGFLAREQYERAAGVLSLADTPIDAGVAGPLQTVPEALRGSWLFAQAQALQGLKKWTGAEALYRAFLSAYPAHVSVPAAKLGRAACLLEQGPDAQKEGRALLEELATASAPGPVRAGAALALAQQYLQKKEFPSARRVLQELIRSAEAVMPTASAPEKDRALSSTASLAVNPSAAAIPPAARWEGLYWLGKIAVEEKQWAAAVEAFSKITSDARAFPQTLVAQSWRALGYSQRAMSQHEQALAAFQKSYQLAGEDALRLEGVRQSLQSAQTLGRISDAVDVVRLFAKEHAGQPVAAEALLAAARAQAEAGNAEKAAALLETLQADMPAPRWRAAAELEQARLAAATDRARAQKLLEALLTRADTPVEIAQPARLLRGNLLLEAGDAAGAVSAYEEILAADAPSATAEPSAPAVNPLAEETLYNLTLAYIALEKIDNVEKTIATLDAKFPESNWRSLARARQAEFLEAQGQHEAARKIYEGLAATGASGSRAVKRQALFHLAALMERTGKATAALPLYDQLADDNAGAAPADLLTAQAAVQAAWIRLGRQELTRAQAQEKLAALWQKQQKTPEAAPLLFTIASLLHNAEDYAGAQSRFEEFLQRYPQSPLAPAAAYYAGKAALLHQDYVKAIALLDKVPENTEFKRDARLLQGKVYYAQLQYDKALTLFEAALEIEKGGPRFADALLRKGDCHFALGSKDPAQYEKALAAYGLLLDGQYGNIAERHEAAVRRARTLEKLGRDGEALALYLDVLHQRLAATNAGASDSKTEETIWRVKAGLEAGRMLEARQDWRGALNAYQTLESLGGPTQAEFRDLATRLRREHYLFD